MGTSPVAWLIFGAFLAIVVTAFISEPRYKKMMKKLPKEHTPVLGSLNPDLIEYANNLGKTIPTPDECIEIVKGFSIDKKAEVEKVECRFCRKCGTQLTSDSDFCHKCGTEIVK